MDRILKEIDLLWKTLPETLLYIANRLHLTENKYIVLAQYCKDDFCLYQSFTCQNMGK